MALLRFRHFDELKDSMSRIVGHALSACTVELTDDEFVSTFIEPAHVGLLQQVRRDVGPIIQSPIIQNYTLSDFSRAIVEVRFGGNEPPVVIPSYVSHGPTPNASVLLKKRIKDWLEERYSLGKLAGDAVDTLYFLNENCSNMASFAERFPALRVLVDECIRLPDVANWEHIAMRLSARARRCSLDLPAGTLRRMNQCSEFILQCASSRRGRLKPLPLSHANLRVIRFKSTRSSYINSGGSNVM